MCQTCDKKIGLHAQILSTILGLMMSMSIGKKKLIINKKDVTLLNSLATFHGTWYWTRKNLLSFQDPPIVGSTQASHTLDFLKNICNSSIFFQSQPLSLGRDHCLAIVMMIYVHFDDD